MKEFHLDFEDKYCAFLDVLGFSELVFSDNTNALQTYFNTIVGVLDRIGSDKEEIQSLSISDSIILFAPNNLRQFKLLLTAIRTIQCELLNKNILVRGAVSFGKAQFDKPNNILVGKGYIKAYQLEREAVYPRVIIDPIIIPKIAEDRTEFMKIMNGDAPNPKGKALVHTGWFRLGTQDLFKDNLLFVDYLDNYDAGEILGIIDNLISFLKANLYGKPHDIPKYQWLNHYLIEKLMNLQNSVEADKVNQVGSLIKALGRL